MKLLKSFGPVIAAIIILSAISYQFYMSYENNKKIDEKLTSIQSDVSKISNELRSIKVDIGDVDYSVSSAESNVDSVDQRVSNLESILDDILRYLKYGY
ncbi:hypothetical protein PAECIP111893_02437 [Paenibacillus plantiphilus]|uniref:Uncharacterized protein n=1 Tax=Paenibacillus plantiphilus TaxID=2905650 RepID=A0ABN8GI36_9BACL|nr:hypothetical protein [Paenibacillus plantiphilus]CAH1205848.1 hypothetical protein PAECIP111893_02437 [Paenibacillus plantiphilus]